jgi:HEPN domain-containing protein
MDIQKQIEYWVKGAEDDFAAAQYLLAKGYLRQCLFLTHLAIEKMLKANVTRETNDVPPKIHNLARLAESAGLEIDAEQKDFLTRFGVYQIEGRYPDFLQIELDKKATEERLSLAGEILQWLKNQL